MKARSSIVSLAILLALCAVPVNAQTIRVNLGGAAYTDSHGNTWQADNGCVGGSAFDAGSQAISGTADPTLFESIHYAAQGASYTCTYSVANGTYTVNLSFAELWGSHRNVNVKINGTVALTAFDVFGKVGGYAADIETFNATVSNGSMTIELDSPGGNGYIDAIEILPSSPPQHQAVLTWTDSLNPSGTQYNVYRTAGAPNGTIISCTNFIRLNGNPVSALTYTDTTIVSGYSYCWEVRAINGSGESIAGDNLFLVVQ